MIDNYNVTDMDTAIVKLIYCAGSQFSFGDNNYFKKVLKVTKTAPP